MCVFETLRQFSLIIDTAIVNTAKLHHKHGLHTFFKLGLILHEGIASMPPGHCLGALEMLWCSGIVEIYLFLIKQVHCRVPFTNDNMPWCPCPFKNELACNCCSCNGHKQKMNP